MLATHLSASTTLQQGIFSDSGNLLSCPFLRKPLLGVADKMREPCFNGLTRRCGGRQRVFTQPAREALQVERVSWCYLPTDADYAESARFFAGCDGDKTKKPSRSGVTACFDSWVTVRKNA